MYLHDLTFGSMTQFLCRGARIIDKFNASSIEALSPGSAVTTCKVASQNSHDVSGHSELDLSWYNTSSSESEYVHGMSILMPTPNDYFPL